LATFFLAVWDAKANRLAKIWGEGGLLVGVWRVKNRRAAVVPGICSSRTPS